MVHPYCPSATRTGTNKAREQTSRATSTREQQYPICAPFFSANMMIATQRIFSIRPMSCQYSNQCITELLNATKRAYTRKNLNRREYVCQRITFASQGGGVAETVSPGVNYRERSRYGLAWD